MSCCAFLKLLFLVLIGSVFADECGTIISTLKTVPERTTVNFSLVLSKRIGHGVYVEWYHEMPNTSRSLLCDSQNSQCEQSNKYTLSKNGYTLSIKTVTHSDSGNYICRCYDQDHDHGWSLRGYLNLTRVRTPTKPVFRNLNTIYGCEQCLYARESHEQIVECYTERVTLGDELTLRFEGRPVETTTVNETQKITIRYNYTAHPNDFLSEFSCSFSSPSLERTRLETKTKVYILQKPSIKYEQIHLRENETTTLNCTSQEGRPPLAPTMTLGTRILNISQSILDEPVSFRYNVTSTFLTSFSRNNITDSLKCCVQFFGDEICEENPLNLMYPPLEVHLVETKKSNNKDGSTKLTLNCSSGVSNPPSDIHWHLPSDTLEQSRKTVDYKATAAAVHEVLQVSLTKRHNGKSILCSVTNKEFPEVNLTSMYTLNITYEPVIKISDDWRRKIKTGEDITLRCSVDSNPPSTIGWYQGQTLVSGDCNLLRRQCDTSANNKLDLYLKNISADGSSVYRCIAKSTIATVDSEIVKLDIIEPDTNFKDSSTLEDTSHVTTFIVVAGVVAAGVMLTVTVVVIICKKQRKNDIHRTDQKSDPTQTNSEGTEGQNKSLPNDSGQPRSRQLSERVTSDVQHEAGHSPGALYDQQASSSAAEQVNLEYATVVPKKDRISSIPQRETNKVVVKEEESATEYATVVKSRQPSCSVEQTTQGGNDRTEHGLVYADLDLVSRPRMEMAIKEHEATEYVSIDFQKTATLRSQKK